MRERMIPLQEGASVITTGAEISWNGQSWDVHKFLDTSEPPYIEDNNNVVRIENGIPYEIDIIENGEFYDDMYPMFLECHDDYVIVSAANIYGVMQENKVTVEDVKSFGNSGSGMSVLGTIMGDHREIHRIYEDALDYFEREHPEHFSKKKEDK